MQAIKQLHPDIISNVQSKTLFSKQEENLLGTVLSVSTNNMIVYRLTHRQKLELIIFFHAEVLTFMDFPYFL